MPVFAWKGETLEEYWWCTERAIDFGDGQGPQPDRGRRRRRDAADPQGGGVRGGRQRADVKADSDPEEWGVILELLKKTLAETPTRWTKAAPRGSGVSEETTTGVHRLYEMQKAGTLLPGHQRERLRHQEQVRQPVRLPASLVDGLFRASDVMISGKVAVVCGYGDVGKGCCAEPQAARGPG